jgi:hypothetical protein
MKKHNRGLHCRALGWGPAKRVSPSLGAVAASNRKNSATLAMLLACLSCVSNGSPPPAPSPEVSSEGLAVQSPPPPTQPAPAQASPSPGPPAAAAELSRELSALPESVLVGTDVVPLVDYLASAVPIGPSGTFRSEQGGATAEVRITPGTQGVTLTREFTEPGTTAQIKRYDGLQARANGVRLSGTNLEVLGTRQSLLVLEKRSRVDGIPDSLWIEYERVGAVTPSKRE